MLPGILQAGSIAADAVETIIETDRVRAGYNFHCLSIIAMDKTTAIATLIEIGILDGTKQIPIDSTPGNFPANTSHTIYWPSILQEGQRAYAKFLTPTAGDQLVLYAHGYYEEIERC